MGEDVQMVPPGFLRDETVEKCFVLIRVNPRRRKGAFFKCHDLGVSFLFPERR